MMRFVRPRRADVPFVVVLCAGAGLRLAHLGGGAGAVLHLLGLAVAVAAYVVVVRWGVWRCLGALSVVPALIDQRVIGVESAAGTASVIGLALACVLVAACWRLRSPGVFVSLAAGTFALVAVSGLAHVHPLLDPPPVGPVDVPTPVTSLGLLLAALAVAGLGRASGSALRWPALLLAGLPLLVVVEASGWDLSSWPGAAPAVLWWPVAGAIGLTALLRGRRGRAVTRPQVDEVDEAALAAFRSRYGEPRLAPVVVVIAAYNEAEGIEDVLATLPKELCGLTCDVVVVDDGSADGTADAIESTRAYAVSCPLNRGQGAALRLGYRVAREHGASYVVTTDADGQYDVDDLPTVLAPILDGRADFVTGSRILGHQHTHDRVRRAGVHVFARIASVLTGQRLTDTSFGLRAMRAEVPATLTLNQPQYQSSELLLGAISRGFSVIEVPGIMHVRSAGTTKKGGNLVYGSRYARVMLGTWWREGCPRPVAGSPALLGTPRPGQADRLLAAVLTRGRATVGRLWATERPFVVALALGLLVRVGMQVAFPPAFVFSDGPTYLGMADHLVPSPDRPVGYGVLIAALAHLSRSVALVAVTQHVLGLATATLMYAALRRWGVSSLVAALATLPVLLDAMELVLEHSPLSDVSFDLLLVAGIATLGWRRRPGPAAVALGGLLLGLATLVRIVGEPTVLAAAIFCAAVGVGLTLWRRAALVLVVCLSFMAPLVAYASWYHAENGHWALTQASGRALYMRTTGFVDCSRVQLPAYERQLCPPEPVGQRRDPTDYGWHSDASKDLDLPPGTTNDQVLRDFAMRAIRAQPGGYAAIVARDFAMNFYPVRKDLFEYDTAYKWRLAHYVDYRTTSWSRPAYAAHGGEQPRTRHPLGDILASYGAVAYLPGPVLLALALLGVAGLVVRRPTYASSTRPLIFLLLATGLGLVLVPDLTAEFVWRYQLPALLLVPMAAALGWTRIRVPPAQPRGRSGTTATPSTD